ncbi:MAG: EpsG family protein [Legionella sp.]|nr:EpsG family protein [Legionella sp.]
MRLKISNLPFISLLLIGVVIDIFAIGFRPKTIGSDTIVYMTYYNDILTNGAGGFNFDYLFDLLVKCTASLNFSSGYFFASIALINFFSCTLISKVLVKYFDKQISFYRIFFLVTSLFFLSPFFLSLQINVLRQGLSTLILLLYFLLLLEGAPLLILAIVALLAQGFHHTSIFYILFTPLFYFKYSFVVRNTIFCAVLYVLGINQYLINRLAPSFYNQIVAYGASSGYSSGIQYKFVLFTLVSGFGFQMLGKYLLRGVEQKQFFYILKIYWILTIPFFLLGFAAFADRYLLPAWVYLSILAASFIVLSLKKSNISIYWYYLLFLFTSAYFILRTQGAF